MKTLLSLTALLLSPLSFAASNTFYQYEQPKEGQGCELRPSSLSNDAGLLTIGDGINISLSGQLQNSTAKNVISGNAPVDCKSKIGTGSSIQTAFVASQVNNAALTTYTESFTFSDATTAPNFMINVNLVSIKFEGTVLDAEYQISAREVGLGVVLSTKLIESFKNGTIYSQNYLGDFALQANAPQKIEITWSSGGLLQQKVNNFTSVERYLNDGTTKPTNTRFGVLAQSIQAPAIANIDDKGPPLTPLIPNDALQLFIIRDFACNGNSTPYNFCFR
jgi:hypothetical protein